MTAWAVEMIGMGGEGKYPAAGGERTFRENIRPDLYDLYVCKAAQAQGLVAYLYIPKGVTVAASDTFTGTIKAA